jgi:WD40 repeat protein
MMPSSPLTASLINFVTPIEAGAHVVAVGFLGPVASLAIADGTLVLVGNSGQTRVSVFGDATSLVAVYNLTTCVLGSDDGRIASVDRHGNVSFLADANGAWIDAIALRTDGVMAWSAGNTVRSRDANAVIRSFVAPSSVRGLAFYPKGYRLAASHYNGVSLWYPNLEAAPEILSWKGSHLQITISQDGRFVITAMQENALHGWKLPEKKDMRMTGYPGKSRSLSWSHDGNWLATSGAQACIIWPFQSKSGPMGQSPRECGGRSVRVSCVAFHPGALVVAVGYEDGWVLLCRLTDGAEIPVRMPNSEAKSGAVTALAWDVAGKRLAMGTGSGQAALLSLPN